MASVFSLLNWFQRWGNWPGVWPSQPSFTMEMQLWGNSQHVSGVGLECWQNNHLGDTIESLLLRCLPVVVWIKMVPIDSVGEALLGSVSPGGQGWALRFQKLKPGTVSFSVPDPCGFRCRTLISAPSPEPFWLHAAMLPRADNGLNLWTVIQPQVNAFLYKSCRGLKKLKKKRIKNMHV